MDQAAHTPVTRIYPGGIRAIDTQLKRAELAASFLMIEAERGAFIEAGTGHSPPGLLAALDAAGIAREHVDYVIVTHVHLDHTGGAGALMEALPDATLVVHPRGERHVNDPSKLIRGASAVYGEAELYRQFGDIKPTPQDRILIAQDGDCIELAGRPLRFVDTPGHAKHHFCVWDEKTRGWFTGDTFGISYREFDTQNGPFIFPTTTPIDFDPDAMHASIDKLMAREPECVYLTHYGRVDHPEQLAPNLHRRVDALAAIAKSHANDPQREAKIYQAMQDWLLDELAEHGVTLPVDQQKALLELDLDLNTQGLIVWLERSKPAS